MTLQAEIGPTVVALGGGHGLAKTLQAAVRYSPAVTGIVSIADDGGSSGALRNDYDAVVPGDMRRCLSALTTEDSLLARYFENRCTEGVLASHPVGNLLLATLTVHSGSFQQAIDEARRLLNVTSRLFPATQAPVKLQAQTSAGVITGQVAIEQQKIVHSIGFAEPCAAPASAVTAVSECDQIVIGPGSFYTSVLAACVVPNLVQAITESTAQLVFVANITNHHIAEDATFDLEAQLNVLAAHGLLPDKVISPKDDDVVSASGLIHDPQKLGVALAACIDR